MDKSKDTLNRVKEKVDFIYSITNGVEYKDGFKALNDKFLEECVTALVKRCILQKTRYYRKGSPGTHYIFTWIASMAPTETLYINVYKDLQSTHVAKQERWKLAKRAQRQREKEAGEEIKTKELNNSFVVPCLGQVEQNVKCKELSDYTPQELWNELRARGYQIEENRIVFIQKTYLD